MEFKPYVNRSVKKDFPRCIHCDQQMRGRGLCGEHYRYYYNGIRKGIYHGWEQLEEMGLSRPLLVLPGDKREDKRADKSCDKRGRHTNLTDEELAERIEAFRRERERDHEPDG